MWAWEATATLILVYVRVLVTGMSGVGKSTLVRELRRRGFRAYDADDDSFGEPRGDGRWGWRVERVADVLERGEAAPDLLFFAGCSEEQVGLPFDYRVLLTAPAAILVQRLMARTTNGYGRSAEQRAQVLADLADVEPLLRRSADLVLVTTEPTPLIADTLLGHALPTVDAHDVPLTLGVAGQVTAAKTGEASSLAAAQAVAREHGVGLRRGGADCRGSNVLVHLKPAPVVARVMTGTAVLHDDVEQWLAREVAVGAFLAERTDLVFAPSDILPPGPHEQDGLWMTAVEVRRTDAQHPPPEPRELGRSLRELHAALADFPGDLAPLSEVRDWLERLLAELRPRQPARSGGSRSPDSLARTAVAPCRRRASARRAPDPTGP